MHEKWIRNKEVSKENQGLSFLDLSSAFDTLNTKIFCQKLKCYGFTQKSTEWFRSYLTGRKQCVNIGSSISSEVTLSLGCPQGAILSPTIFLILLADIELWTDSSLCGYADDTSSVTTEKSVEKLVKKTEETVEDLFKFMAVNRLVAND